MITRGSKIILNVLPGVEGGKSFYPIIFENLLRKAHLVLIDYEKRTGTLDKIKNSIIDVLTKASSSPLLSGSVAKMAAKVYPPPFLRNDMEFMYGAWRGTSTVKGSDGRYLGEDNASPAFYCEPVHTEYHICKFGDSREGKQYNMTALQDMMKVWPEVMFLIDTYRDYYIEWFNTHDKELSVVDLFIFSKLLVAATAYLIRSQDHDLKHENVPVELTSQTKLVAGVFMIGRTMIERGDPVFDDSKPASADLMYEYADKHHILISPRDREFACAGSIRKIKELIEVTIRGWHSKSTSRPSNELLQIVDESYRYAFDYGLKDLQMELSIKYAEVVILEVLFNSGPAQLPEEHKHIIDEHLKVNFSCEFTDLQTLPDQKKNLIILFDKLGLDPIEPNTSISDITTFQAFYTQYLEQIRAFAFTLQNEINSLLKIKKLERLSISKVNKRLNIIPARIFKQYIKQGS